VFSSSAWLLGSVLAAATPALATLTLTPAGINDGFTLSTFATIKPGNTGCCEGPFGVAISGSNVIASYGFFPPPSNLAVFADSDGQTLAQCGDRFFAVQLVASGAPRRIDESAPETCPIL
jgi:hypothetical protein